MHFATVLISSVLAVAVTAASTAQAPAPVAPAPVPAAPAPSLPSPDNCGPKIQLPSDPTDTCLAGPAKVDSPSAYGIFGLSNSFTFAGFDWSICHPVVDMVCDAMAKPETASGTWSFTTSQVHLDYANPACQMGFYLPSDPAAAPKPSPAQCRNIFGSMLNAAEYSGWRWFGSTVNLAVNPATAAGQFALPGGSGTGKQNSHVWFLGPPF